VELPADVRRQIDEWIFSNLLDAIALDAAQPHSMFAASVVPAARGGRVGYEHVQEELPGVIAQLRRCRRFRSVQGLRDARRIASS